HRRHHRRGAGPSGRGGDDRPVRDHPLARAARLAPRLRAVRHLPGPGHHLADGLPGGGEHGRGHGAAAHQGPDAALRLLRRLVAVDDDGGHGRAAVDQRHRGGEGGRRGRRRRFEALPFHGAGGRADVRVLIAGGGTGGHLFPGIALAEEVSTRHHKNSVVFVGTDRGLEARVVPAAGYTLEIIPARGLKGMGLLRLLQGLFTLPAALFAFWRILRKYRPDVVVGVGGYASFPVVLCAWLQRVPTAVQEQNALPGLTNRILGRIARVVFISFEEARRWFPAGKSNLIGNPIRAKLTDNFLRSRAEHAKFTVLVFGGSLGAKRVNALMLEALDQLGDLKEGMRFVHQTGKADLESVKQGYAARGFDAEVVEFIDDMSSAYATADLVVCRAGATTVAELTVCKTAAILIPYP